MQVVFTNGVVWTGFRTPVGVYTTHALAVNDGRIAALGDAAVKLQSQAETVIDLQGAFLMSAFGDGHAHPLQGGARHLMAPVE